MINSSSDEEKKDKLPKQHRTNQSAQKEVDIYAASELRDDDDDTSFKKLFNMPNNKYVTQKFESSCLNTKMHSDDGTLHDSKTLNGEKLEDERNSNLNENNLNKSATAI